MCTRKEVGEEVRTVIREAATPQIVKYIMWLFGISIFALMSWLTYTVHEQDSTLVTSLGELKESYSKSLSQINISNARLAGKIGMLTTELKNIKEIALSQSKYRSIVVDERCKSMNNRIERLEETIEKHHRLD